MGLTESLLDNMYISRSDHLPIVAAFCRRIGLVETVNRVVPSNMEVDVGTIVQAMVLDTLSGRSPLYRLADFIKHQDTELLLGRELIWTAFNDTTVGRAMDMIFDSGAQKLFSEVAFQAAMQIPLDMSYVHFDTTSVNVWGDYDVCNPDTDNLNITYGHSKDKRPDLKQFLIKMLCVGRKVPILGGCEDGNKSDKPINNDVLSRISRHMAKFGLSPGAFIYIADSAMVTEDNLKEIGDNLFVTRLPFTYAEANKVVSEAVAHGGWNHIGALNETPSTDKRPSALYSIMEKTVSLYGQEYRAIVVYSSAHDKRRLKRIDRQIRKSKNTLDKLIAKQSKQEYYCRADAQAAASNLSKNETELHRIEVSVSEKIRYRRGRPPKNGTRKVDSVRYILNTKTVENTEQVERKREESGCFVLLSNVELEGKTAKTGEELLRAYKEQHGIERNFSFLKDPLIVNDLFLKKPGRVETIGAIILIALLVWNLIEHVLRQYVTIHDAILPGWDNKVTRRPTAFMMSTKFMGIQVIKIGHIRRLASPLNDAQLMYLKAMGLSEQSLLMPASMPRPG
jgi:transposase